MRRTAVRPPFCSWQSRTVHHRLHASSFSLGSGISRLAPRARAAGGPRPAPLPNGHVLLPCSPLRCRMLHCCRHRPHPTSIRRAPVRCHSPRGPDSRFRADVSALHFWSAVRSSESKASSASDAEVRPRATLKAWAPVIRPPARHAAQQNNHSNMSDMSRTTAHSSQSRCTRRATALMLLRASVRFLGDAPGTSALPPQHTPDCMQPRGAGCRWAG